MSDLNTEVGPEDPGEAPAALVETAPLDPALTEVLGTAMIGGDRRMAPVREAFYALRQGYLHRPGEYEGPHDGLSLWGNTVSDWNYIGSDRNALTRVTNRFGRWNASVSNFFSPDIRYGRYQGYGRGGQCFFFAALLLWRSVNYDLPNTYTALNRGQNGAASGAQPGDIIFQPTGTKHVALVVKRLGGGLDVIDSNAVAYGDRSYAVGYNGRVANSELIARHPYSWNQLRSYKLFSGRGRWY